MLQFLREVSANQVCGALNDGLKDNTPNAVFTYLPGRGTAVEVKGAGKGVIEGKEFADALFRAWIGPRPGPGEDVKKKLLGVTSSFIR